MSFPACPGPPPRSQKLTVLAGGSTGPQGGCCCTVAGGAVALHWMSRNPLDVSAGRQGTCGPREGGVGLKAAELLNPDKGLPTLIP